MSDIDIKRRLNAATSNRKATHLQAEQTSSLPTKPAYSDIAGEGWRRSNIHIHTGFHPLTRSWAKSWGTLLGRPHNETVNIITHLAGAIVVAYFFIYSYRHLALPDWFGVHPLRTNEINRLALVYPFPRPNESVSLMDAWAFSSFYVAAILCFGCSATFHTSLCHSQAVAEAYNKLDYVGIVFLITGTYYPALYYGFYGQPVYQIVYIAGVTMFGALTAYFVLSTGAHRRLRTWLFIGLGLSGVIPIIQQVASLGLEGADKAIGLRWLAIGGAFYIVGALMYAEHVPERFAPGRFDIYGNSHQIFHVACLAAATFHYVALCRAFHYHHYS